LMHRPARHYEDLHIFENATFPTYHEAAIHLGLFTSNDEGFYAMEEAVASYVPPSQLWFEFAHIIMEGYPARPLWDAYHDALSIDFIHGLHSSERGIDSTLQQIGEFIEDGGRSLQQYGLPQPQQRSPEVISEIEAFEDQLDVLYTQASNEHATMNLEQQHVFHSIYNVITHANDTRNACQPCFIEGRPGRGKTYVVDVIIKMLRSRGKIVLTVGTSALAASLHERGRTAHSLFDIPVADVCCFHVIPITTLMSITRIT
jgi:hypothetical protein